MRAEWFASTPLDGEGDGRVPVLPVPRSFPLRGWRGGCVVRAWANGETKPLAMAELGVAYRRYRLAAPSAEDAMARSLRGYGQLSPVTACRRNDRAELLDGFKRHAAAAAIAWPTLSVRLVEADERSAKAAIFGLYRAGRHPSGLEEAWIVQALVREDGLSQVD